MPARQPTIEIPQRVLLSGQVADTLRDLIDQGQWTEVLPAERQLSEQFHVSRPTIRAALQLLTREGRITAEKGRRPRIVAQRPAMGPPAQSRKVLLVTHESPSRLSPIAYQRINEMQGYLAKHGLNCEVYLCPTRGLAGQLRKLDQHIRQHGVVCCLLATVRQPVQQWFVDQSLPALVLGSCHPTVALPSFDVEHRSVCRHAAGVLLAKGHRKLALIVPASLGPGDRASTQGFLEAFELNPGQATPVVVYHEDTPASLHARVRSLFAAPHPPTALIVTRTKYALLILVQLSRQGVLIPENVSLIARDQDSLFNDLSPKIAHYSFDLNAYTKRLARLILQLANQKHLSLKPNLIFPKFEPGESVKTPPKTTG